MQRLYFQMVLVILDFFVAPKGGKIVGYIVNGITPHNQAATSQQPQSTTTPAVISEIFVVCGVGKHQKNNIMTEVANPDDAPAWPPEPFSRQENAFEYTFTGGFVTPYLGLNIKIPVLIQTQIQIQHQVHIQAIVLLIVSFHLLYLVEKILSTHRQMCCHPRANR